MSSDSRRHAYSPRSFRFHASPPLGHDHPGHSHGSGPSHVSHRPGTLYSSRDRTPHRSRSPSRYRSPSRSRSPSRPRSPRYRSPSRYSRTATYTRSARRSSSPRRSHSRSSRRASNHKAKFCRCIVASRLHGKDIHNVAPLCHNKYPENTAYKKPEKCLQLTKTVFKSLSKASLILMANKLGVRVDDDMTKPEIQQLVEPHIPEHLKARSFNRGGGHHKSHRRRTPVHSRSIHGSSSSSRRTYRDD